MRTFLCWLGLALGPMLAHGATMEAEQPQFRQVGVAEGLPSNGVTALALDRDGFLWIGTRDGLARYDGVVSRNCPDRARRDRRCVQPRWR